MSEEAAREITDAEFQSAVVERSREVPVVIDLWAPWCGPCRQLGPVLEQAARERAGEFELVKLNVDENPQVAQMLGARSIPLVVAFRDGAPVSSFVGAQPLAAVNRFIDGLQPSDADLKVKAAATSRESGDVEGAEALLRDAIAIDPNHKAARLDLAELLANAERFDESLEVLRVLPSTGHDNVGRLMAEIRTRMAAGIDTEAIEARLRENPDDLDAAIELGKALVARGDHEAGLDTLLAALTRDPKYRDGAARQAMIDVFDTLGGASPVTREYRKRMSRALF